MFRLFSTRTFKHNFLINLFKYFRKFVANKMSVRLQLNASKETEIDKSKVTFNIATRYFL